MAGDPRDAAPLPRVAGTRHAAGVRPLLIFMVKDLRLLWRDRAGLMFLLVAPLIVISVAGFSLANLYGADPTGQTAYDFPLVDEDGGELARHIRDRLAREPAVRVRPVSSREQAQKLVRSKQAGSALVIPHGTEAALDAGMDATLIVYTDPVKYLERLNVHTRLLELRDAIATEHAAHLTAEAAAQRERLSADLTRLKERVAEASTALEAARHEATRARTQALEQARRDARRARDEAARTISTELERSTATLRHDLDRQVGALRSMLAGYVSTLAAARRDFEQWLATLTRMAGSHAGDIPPPPRFPDVPNELTDLIDGRRAPIELAVPAMHLALPEVAPPQLPAVPELPAVTVPAIELPAPPAPPSVLEIREVNLTGGPAHINTFDQNVPGFAVTFLMLGMLLGISLGLLDEREWGTFDRMRALPVAPSQFMLAKLLARFLVGVVQMVLLLAVGWLAFDVSLGPQPGALLLPVCGIAFAGTAFGLVVAAIATSREAVFSVGSVVMVTMAAVGGCWWPIDLEPRWMRSVALAFPTTWAMDAFNDLMIRRRTIEAAVAPTAVMVAYGLLYLAAGLTLFRRRLR